MLDGRYVAEHLDEVRAGLSRRSAETAKALDSAAGLFAKRRELIQSTEKLQADRNRASQEMGKLAKGPDREAFEARRAELKTLSDDIKQRESELSKVEAEVEDLLLGIPNLPHASSPDGGGEADNVVRRTVGEAPKFDFEPKAHWDLGEALGILDFERAAKLSGARFTVLMGAGARLERSLTSFMLDLHTREHGYTEVYPPFMVRAEALRGTGQLPKFETDLFKTQRGPEDPTPLYLIPTAEVPVTNLHADEILDGANLPIAYTAFTPCFRSEAGSHGKDVRGLIRNHQFDKVELVRIVKPEQALEQLELLTSHAEEVLKRLGLHYRVSELCTGDLGFGAEKTYDLEVWLPSQQAYREISSCSSFGDYQARRAKIRFRPEPKAKPKIAATLNGSALAVGRTLVAVLEQYQRADGSIAIPKALVPYFGADTIPAA
ncbi:MAG: serine--tRNA ligase [Polyangiaceae bacterium]